MRALTLCTLFSLALLAGCSDNGSDSLDTDLTGAIELRYVAPGAIYANESVMGSFADASTFVTGADPCSGATIQCDEYVFSVNQTQAYRVVDGNATMVAGTFMPGNETGVNVTAAPPITVDVQLTWPRSSDFDLYLYKGTDTTAVAQSVNPLTTPVTQSEQFTAELVEGDYRLVVVAFAVAEDTYSLAVTFPDA